jgi:hypothetical protein
MPANRKASNSFRSDRMDVKPEELFIVHYREAGEWARHYSTIRMGVPTFLIGTSVVLLTEGAKSKDGLYLLASLLTWLAAILFLGFYTIKTQQFETLQKQIRHLIDPSWSSRHRDEKPKPPVVSESDTSIRKPPMEFFSFMKDLPCWLVFIFTCIYGVELYLSWR